MFHFLRWLPAPFLAVLLIAVGPLLSGCAGPDPALGASEATQLRFEPVDITFHPDDRDAVNLRIVNSGSESVELRYLGAVGPYGGVLAFEDESVTRLLPGLGTQMTARMSRPKDMRADPFLNEAGAQNGAAGIAFEANGKRFTVPVRFERPTVWSAHVGPGLVKILLLVMAFIMPLATLLTWVERKQSAMMQDRLGPNMAGIRIGGVNLRLWGLLHAAADALKMLFKEDFIPRHAHKVLYTLGPLMAFIPALVVFAIVPFGDALCYGHLGDVLSQADIDQCATGRGGTVLQIANIDVGLLFYFAVASLATYGTTLAGWSSYNKYAILGGLRASAQMISYEVALGMTVVGALLVYGTMEPHALVRAQIDTYWGIVLQPLALVLFFTAAIAETKRAPFDLPEGESEIIGYFVEYSGMRFGLFFLAEFIEIIFASAMVATLFLGGWALPFDILGASGFSSAAAGAGFFSVAGLAIIGLGVGAMRADEQRAGVFGAIVVLIGFLHLVLAVWCGFFPAFATELPHGAVVLIGMVTWGLKVAGLCWFQLLVRWTLPRFRYDQLMSLGWKGLLPLSLANIVFTALVVYLMLPVMEPVLEATR